MSYGCFVAEVVFRNVECTGGGREDVGLKIFTVRRLP